MSAVAEHVEETSFGIALEEYLAAVAAHGVQVGPGDRLTINALAIELLGRGRISSIEDFKPYLASVLRHAPEAAPLFVPAGTTSDTPAKGAAQKRSEGYQRGEASLTPESRLFRKLWQNWHKLALILAAMITSIAFGYVLWDRIARVVGDPVETVEPRLDRSTTSQKPPDPDADPSPVSDAQETLERVLEAGLDFYGAPTLSELATNIEVRNGVSTTEATLAHAIHELTGLSVHQPLDLSGQVEDSSPTAPLIARALDRIERPELVRSLSEYRFDDSGETAWREKIAAALGTPEPTELTSFVDGIRDSDRQVPLPEQQARLVALHDPDALSRSDWDMFRKQKSAVPDWVAPLAAIAPLALTGLILFLRLASEIGYLNRRRPRHPPNMTEFVSDALRNSVQTSNRERDLARILQIRDEKTFPRLDVLRTVNQTVRNGGIVTLCNEQVRPTPEYLVLLEMPDPSDHVACAMRELLVPFRRENRVHFDIYTYQKTPSFLYPEMGADAISIERVFARHPDHRLIILGSGHSLIVSMDGRASRTVSTLRKWERRVLLTPLPLSEWGVLEFQIADALDAPLGRATRSGFDTVGELLGLEGAPPESLPNTRGDGAIAELPTILSKRPEQLLRDDGITETRAADVIATVERMLDPDAFRWFASLAVFPALQWDITLYLGLTLPSRRDVLNDTDDPKRMTPCFPPNAIGDRRIASLSRLPWLRTGRMPRWLRAALIDKLSDRDKWHVHQAINKALSDPKVAERSTSLTAHDFRIKIGREPSRDPLRGGTPHQDLLLFEFLRRGDADLYQAPPEIERFFAERYRRPLERFLRAGENLRVAVLGLMTALTAWLVSPVAGAPFATGAWWPLVLVATGMLCFLLVVPISDALSSGATGSWRSGRGRSWMGVANLFKPPNRPAPRRVPRETKPDASDGVEGATRPAASAFPIPEMVRIRRGRFMMGSSAGDPEAFPDETPKHEVQIRAFDLGKCAVTFEEYDAFCEATNREKPGDRGWGRGLRPVINVSWEDAQGYCTWLSEQTGQQWRLPSEAEWEYACRADSTTAYSWGDDWEVGRANGAGAKARTLPVGSFEPNPWGLFDMHGNVFEWGQDCWHEDYENAPEDGSAWMDMDGGDCSQAVLRGGSWGLTAGVLRSASRDWYGRGDRSDFIGFRLARTLPGD